MTVFIGNKKSYATASLCSTSLVRFSLLTRLKGLIELFISSAKNRHFLNAIFLRPGFPYIIVFMTMFEMFGLKPASRTFYVIFPRTGLSETHLPRRSLSDTHTTFKPWKTNPNNPFFNYHPISQPKPNPTRTNDCQQFFWYTPHLL
jgi:hypothetical protein